MIERHPETALIPYSRGELSGEERARIEAHLRECEQCREFAESSGGVLNAVGRMVASTPEPNWIAYRAELRRKLAERTEPREVWWRPRLVWMSFAAAGAAALALLLVISVRKPIQPAGPPMDQMAMASQFKGADVGLLQNYKVVEHLDLLENYDVIENLPSSPQQGNEKTS
jgi:anti-sigma-K factor RskA